jgi:hypothetical protein
VGFSALQPAFVIPPFPHVLGFVPTLLALVHTASFFSNQSIRWMSRRSTEFLLNQDDFSPFMTPILGVTQSNFPSTLIKFLSH